MILIRFTPPAIGVAVLAQKRVLAVDTLDKVAATDDPWIQSYFHGPRGRAASHSATQNLTERN